MHVLMVISVQPISHTKVLNSLIKSGVFFKAKFRVCMLIVWWCPSW